MSGAQVDNKHRVLHRKQYEKIIEENIEQVIRKEHRKRGVVAAESKGNLKPEEAKSERAYGRGDYGSRNKSIRRK